jgi:hypothetical protein
VCVCLLLQDLVQSCYTSPPTIQNSAFPGMEMWKSKSVWKCSLLVEKLTESRFVIRRANPRRHVSGMADFSYILSPQQLWIISVRYLPNTHPTSRSSSIGGTMSGAPRNRKAPDRSALRQPTCPAPGARGKPHAGTGRVGSGLGLCPSLPGNSEPSLPGNSEALL